MSKENSSKIKKPEKTHHLTLPTESKQLRFSLPKIDISYVEESEDEIDFPIDFPKHTSCPDFQKYCR